jgi:hypothetical protein
MAVLNLASLVLRGVSVLGDGQTVNLLRRDASYAGGAGAPTVRISMRHPSSGCRQAFMQPAGRPDHEDENLVAQAVPGAGRSLSRAGVLSRRSPARIAGRAILSGWSPAVGGPKPTAAAGLCLIKARPVAPVGVGTSGRLTAVNARALPSNGNQPVTRTKASWRLTVVPAGVKPAGWTLPASTRGKGDR